MATLAVLEDRPIERVRGEFVLSTDRRRLDVAAALALLRTTFWAGAMRRDVLERSIANSVCFAVYRRQELVGLARVVSDLATYAYVTDVVVAEAYRGRGLGSWLVEAILAHPELQGLRRVALLTRGAAGLYQRYGFTSDTRDQTYLERRPDVQPGTV